MLAFGLWPLDKPKWSFFVIGGQLNSTLEFLIRYVLSAFAQLFTFFFYKDDFIEDPTLARFRFIRYWTVRNHLNNLNEIKYFKYFLDHVCSIENMVFIAIGWSSTLLPIKMVGIIGIISLILYYVLSSVVYMVVLNVIDKTRQLFQLCKEVDRFDKHDKARFEKLATDSSIDINFYLDFFYRIRNGCDDSSVFAQDDVYGLTPLEVLCKLSHSNRLIDCLKIIFFQRKNSSEIHLAKALSILIESTNPVAAEAILLFVQHIFSRVDFNMKDKDGKSIALSYLRNGSNSVSNKAISNYCPLIHHVKALLHIMSYLSFGAISAHNICMD